MIEKQGPRKVAWLEPNAKVREFIHKLSKELPGTVISIFATNAELQEHLRAEKPHLGLTHIGKETGRQQGFDALAAIREHHPDTPVIVVTGNQRLSVEELVGKGATAVVEKPFEVKAMLQLQQAKKNLRRKSLGLQSSGPSQGVGKLSWSAIIKNHTEGN